MQKEEQWKTTMRTSISIRDCVERTSIKQIKVKLFSSYIWMPFKTNQVLDVHSSLIFYKVSVIWDHLKNLVSDSNI